MSVIPRIERLKFKNCSLILVLGLAVQENYYLQRQTNRSKNQAKFHNKPYAPDTGVPPPLKILGQ